MSLTNDEKTTLLDLARCALKTAAGIEANRKDIPGQGALLEKRGAFVTLYKEGELRGCIGVFTPDTPLYKTITDMAESAAMHDPRFSPVEADEVPLIDIEISVLTPLKETTNPEDIEIGRHGIYIMKGRNRGVLLPQVATEHGFDRYEFLDQTCLKAGLRPGQWREGATIYTFEAEIFGEKKHN